MNPKLSVILPQHLKEKIIEFAFNDNCMQYFKINSVSPNRRFCALNQHSIPLAETMRAYAKTAFAEIGVPTYIDEHIFGNFIGVNLTGGSVHQHTDRRDASGNYHIRMNFMVQKPELGGNPIIDNKEYEINENDCWINYASEWMHGSIPVQGAKSRVVLSLGAYINPQVVRDISKRIGWNQK